MLTFRAERYKEKNMPMGGSPSSMARVETSLLSTTIMEEVDMYMTEYAAPTHLYSITFKKTMVKWRALTSMPRESFTRIYNLMASWILRQEL